MTAPQIPGFEILEQARESSTAVTWKALQRSLDRVVFVRALKPEVPEAQRQAFEIVARTIARIKHPNLIQVFDVARSSDGLPYVVLEAVEGTMLKEVLRREAQLDPVRAAQIAAALAEALDAAWKQASLIHRNLKPEDISITREGGVKITEFSAATLIQAGVDPLSHDGGLIVGTPNYMSPEQALGHHDLDFHADMYGLGALLYHLVTGTAPFAYEEDPVRVLELQVTGSIPSPRVANAKVSAGLDAVISRLMMKDPRARYAWWQDALADLQRAAKGRPIQRDQAADPIALSTVARYAPPRAGMRRRTGALSSVPTELSAGDVQRPAASGPSEGTRFLLWLVLGCGFAALAYYRWMEPTKQNAPRVETAAVSPRVLPVAPSVAHPVAPSPRSETSTTAAVEAPAPKVDAAAISDALVTAVTDALIRGDRVAARELLRAAAGRSGGDDALRSAGLQAIEIAGNPDDLIGVRLVEKYRGRPVKLTYRDRDCTVIPDRYGAGYAMLKLVAADGTERPWSLQLSELSPADRLRFVGVPPDGGAPDPAADAAIALLAMAANDRELMLRIIPRAPGLEPFLRKAAQR